MLFSLIIIQFFALITPGPDFAFVASTALKGNKKDIFYSCVGITLGVFFWAFLSMTGLHILFAQYPVAQVL
ncbi:MAG: LysE family transporter, partial [Enterobacteriaceae bacterium]